MRPAWEDLGTNEWGNVDNRHVEDECEGADADALVHAGLKMRLGIFSYKFNSEWCNTHILLPVMGCVRSD